jgi:hypothetical protein
MLIDPETADEHSRANSTLGRRFTSGNVNTHNSSVVPIGETIIPDIRVIF